MGKTKTYLLLGAVALVFLTAVLYSQYVLPSSGLIDTLSGNVFSSYRAEKLDMSVMKWFNYTDDADLINGPSIQVDDPALIQKIRQKFLIPPSKDEYNLERPFIFDTSMGQGERIRRILNYRRNGFFIECGALDGETRSNTLYFERYLNWTGLLIEADPFNFAQMLKKNRRSWLSPSCLSVTGYPTIVSFEQNKNVGKISDKPRGYSEPGFVDVQCFPLYSYLLALNISRVDYFSLDIEGSELEVLETVPFDKIDILTLSVEFIHGKKGKEALQEFMEKKGYVVESEVTHPDWLANDFIFVKSKSTVK